MRVNSVCVLGIVLLSVCSLASSCQGARDADRSARPPGLEEKMRAAWHEFTQLGCPRYFSEGFGDRPREHKEGLASDIPAGGLRVFSRGTADRPVIAKK
jgi:hypothetical protein